MGQSGLILVFILFSELHKCECENLRDSVMHNDCVVASKTDGALFHLIMI